MTVNQLPELTREQQIEKALRDLVEFAHWLSVYAGLDTDTSSEATEMKEKLYAAYEALGEPFPL